MNVAHQHIQFRPKTDFLNELMKSLGEEIMEGLIGNVNYRNVEATEINSTETILDDVLDENEESDDV